MVLRSFEEGAYVEPSVILHRSSVVGLNSIEHTMVGSDTPPFRSVDKRLWVVDSDTPPFRACGETNNTTDEQGVLSSQKQINLLLRR